MTEMLKKNTVNREFSRKSFLKGGGALVVGFSLAGAGLAGKAGAAASPDGYLPDITQVDSWLKITPDNKAMLMTSEVELGQGTGTGFLKVVAEELDMDMSQVIYGSSVKDNAGNHLAEKVDSWVALSTGGIGGSQSTVRTSPRIRAAAVAARQALLKLASSKLNTPVANLTVRKGVVYGTGGSASYGELIGGKLMNVKITEPHLNPGEAPAKPLTSSSWWASARRASTSPRRSAGRIVYTHHVESPACSTAAGSGRVRAPTEPTGSRSRFRSTGARSSTSRT